MILGIGTDIIENSRIEDVLERHGQRFMNRVYSQIEQDYCLSKEDTAPFFAVRFAAKEAYIKALNLSKAVTEGISYKEIVVFGKNKGKKELRLFGRAQEVYYELGVDAIHISLSHSRDYSLATVILEKR